MKLGHAGSICKIRVRPGDEGTQKSRIGLWRDAIYDHSEAAARLLRTSRMDQDEEDLFLMQQLAPGNIVGVHNYCDGWCERCGFANRCVVHASLAREPMLKADDPLLEHLKDRFDQVRTLVARRSTFSIE